MLAEIQRLVLVPLELQLIRGAESLQLCTDQLDRVRSALSRRPARRRDEGKPVPPMTTYRLHGSGLEKARALIDARQYDLEGAWSDLAPSTEEENGQIERHGYEGYGEWHLAIDADASEETKDRYGFPYGDFSRVSRSALVHAKQRAAQNGHDEVAGAAGELLDHLDEVRAGP